MLLGTARQAFSVSLSSGMMWMLFPHVHLDLFIWDLCLDAARDMFIAGKYVGQDHFHLLCGLVS